MLGLALKPASITPGMLYVLGLLRHTYMFTSTCLVFPHVLSNLHVGVGPKAGLDDARDALCSRSVKTYIYVYLYLSSVSPCYI